MCDDVTDEPEGEENSIITTHGERSNTIVVAL